MGVGGQVGLVGVEAPRALGGVADPPLAGVSTPALDSTLGWELAPQMGRVAPNLQRPSGQSRPQLPAANRMSAPAASMKRMARSMSVAMRSYA